MSTVTLHDVLVWIVVQLHHFHKQFPDQNELMNSLGLRFCSSEGRARATGAR